MNLVESSKVAEPNLLLCMDDAIDLAKEYFLANEGM